MACIDKESRSPCSSAASNAGETPRGRILLRPQDYIGSIEKCTRKIWVAEVSSFTHRAVTYVPGLYKIFDEVLIYAADNKQSDPSMDSLRVEIDVHQGLISIYYNGKGVPIELHPEKGLYLPEMTFSHLSSHEEISGWLSNCYEEQTGRRNSYGVKLANLFSTEFAVETVDSRREKKFKQGVNWTRITFKPDLAKFCMTHLDDDVIALMKKRVVDVGGFLGVTGQVVFNGATLLQFRNFRDYALCYTRSVSKNTKRKISCVYHRVNGSLEVCVAPSQGTFQQVSFVNKFATTEGGTHVDFVSHQIAYRVAKCCNERLQLQVEESEVKKHLFIIVNLVMENPSFNSLARDALTSPHESFVLCCEISDDFVKHKADRNAPLTNKMTSSKQSDDHTPLGTLPGF
ncbi:hypothetical protein U9M48_043391 [Paspalum notatum var. saurae]|uniref:DNA topoisomerase 2 n=1 Tax=Paspalum notatum var. saurae TaxID=547442 RepID=A0AAQ3XGH4_PASNO